MSRGRAAVAALATTLAVACGACSSAAGDPPMLTTASSEVVLSDALVIADDAFARDARALPGRLVITTRGHEDAIGKLHAGTILASRHSDVHPDANPRGFLRRVEAIAVDGSDTVITTSAASLSDAVVRGSFDMRLGDGAGGLSTRTLQAPTSANTSGLNITLPDVSVLDGETGDVGVGDRSGSVAGSVKLVGSSLHLAAKPDFAVSVADGNVKFRGALTLAYDATSTLAVKAEGEIARSLGKKELGEYPITWGVFFIGLLPVEYSVTSTVSVQCDVYVGGKMDASVAWHAFGAPSAGVAYANGQYAALGTPTDFTLESRTDVKIESTAGIRCSMPVELDTFIYESGGLFASVAPVVELSTTTTSCAPPKQGFAVDVYDELRLGAKLDILGHELADWSTAKDTKKVRLYPAGTSAEATKCAPENDCLTDTECGSAKACAWNGKGTCCRTPTPTAGATKCVDDAGCTNGNVCAWNLEAFVCQPPACN